MARIRSILLLALALSASPPPAGALELHWHSGATALTFTGATRCTLVVVAEPPGPVELVVFDVQGRRVGRPLKRQVLPAGVVDVPLDTSAWREGVCFCRLEAGGQVATRRFTVLR